MTQLEAVLPNKMPDPLPMSKGTSLVAWCIALPGVPILRVLRRQCPGDVRARLESPKDGLVNLTIKTLDMKTYELKTDPEVTERCLLALPFASLILPRLHATHRSRPCWPVVQAPR